MLARRELSTCGLWQCNQRSSIDATNPTCSGPQSRMFSLSLAALDTAILARADTRESHMGVWNVSVMCLPLSPIRLMYSLPLAASFKLVHTEPELEDRAAACLRRLCLKHYHHVGASDSRDPLHPCHSRDGERERL
ncbi:uncharacterized protein LOC144101323 [Amblyomma americanum]